MRRFLNLRDSPNSAILFDRREQSHNRVAASFIFGWKGVVPDGSISGFKLDADVCQRPPSAAYLSQERLRKIKNAYPARPAR